MSNGSLNSASASNEAGNFCDLRALQEGIEDSYEWIVEGVASGKYKTSQVYWELK